MSIPGRIWRIIRGRWLVAEEQVRDALAEEAASRELSEALPSYPDPRALTAGSPTPSAPPRQPAGLRPLQDPLAADLTLLGAPPACNLETLDRVYQERLAELAEEKAANPMLDDGVVARRRSTLSEAYERVRDAINTTETRFEKLEF